MTASRGIHGPRKVWLPHEIELLRREYPDRLTADIATGLGVKLHQVYRQAKQMGLKKTPEFVASTAADRMKKEGHGAQAFQFKKGLIPANKGVKRPGWTAGRMAETQFKKGQRPHTWVPLLSERDYAGYLQIKVSDTGDWRMDWKCVHTLVWEEAHGPIPTGHALVFRDRNRRNFELENLELITRAELMRRNTIHNRVPAELRPIVISLGQIKRRIRERIEQIETAHGERS